jgi:hypothetical protein
MSATIIFILEWMAIRTRLILESECHPVVGIDGDRHIRRTQSIPQEPPPNIMRILHGNNDLTPCESGDAQASPDCHGNRPPEDRIFTPKQTEKPATFPIAAFLWKIQARNLIMKPFVDGRTRSASLVKNCPYSE